MTRRTAVLVLAATAALAQETRPVQRAIQGAHGRTWVALDGDVYEHARADLADLRVVDDRGAATPYLLDRAPETSAPGEPRRPQVRNRRFVRGRETSAELDFGAPVLKNALTLKLPGDNFRRRVMVEGRGRREHEWTTLVEDAWVFAVPEPRAARYETVRLPDNNDAVLRVTVFNGEGDPERLDIEDAWIAPLAERRRRSRVMELPVVRREDGEKRETVLEVDLGARHQPFLGLTVDVEDPRFLRGVLVESSHERPQPREAWTPVREGMLYRMGRVQGDVPMVAALPGERVDAAPPAGASENLRIEAAGRARRLRLRILNRDDAPLRIRGVRADVPEERVVFEAQPGRSYQLTYGRPELRAPEYDLQRTVGDAAVWASGGRPAALAAPEALPTPAPPLPPWTERHPALLWSGLVAVVAVLGLLTWKTLARADA